MDNYFEKIAKIKSDNNEEVSTVPRCLSEDEVKEFFNSFKNLYSDFKSFYVEKDFNGAIDSLNELLYLAFDYLVRISVYPSRVIESIVNAQLFRVIDDKLHYDHYYRIAPPDDKIYFDNYSGKITIDNDIEKRQTEFKVDPNTITGDSLSPIDFYIVQKDFKDSIAEMELGIYKKVNDSNEYVGDIGKLYNIIRKMNIKFGFPHGNIDFSESRIDNFYNIISKKIKKDIDESFNFPKKHSLVNIENYAFCLSDIICIIINIFVEMGINPKEYFEAYLAEKENKKRK